MLTCSTDGKKQREIQNSSVSMLPWIHNKSHDCSLRSVKFQEIPYVVSGTVTHEFHLPAPKHDEI